MIRVQQGVMNRTRIRHDASDQVVAANGEPESDLCPLGPVAMGRLDEIGAVPDLKVQCVDVARRVTRSYLLPRHLPRFTHICFNALSKGMSPGMQPPRMSRLLDTC